MKVHTLGFNSQARDDVYFISSKLGLGLCNSLVYHCYIYCHTLSEFFVASRTSSRSFFPPPPKVAVYILRVKQAKAEDRIAVPV